jgi:DNA-binding transcriptional LysR family regulator
VADEISDLRLFARLVSAGSLSAAARELNSSPPAMSRRLAAMEERLGVRLVARTSRRFELTEEGSLSAAARELNSSPPAMSRRLAAMEERLGVRLVARTSRRFELTEEGSLLHERCLKILAEIDAAEAEASAKGRAPHGLLRVGAPSEFGRRRIAPLISRFTDHHDKVKVHLTLSDAGVDLMESGLDVVLRLGLPAETEVIATKILGGRRVVCAAPAYLAARGIPQTPDDLSRHDCIRLVRDRRVFDRWGFRDGAGRREIRVDGALTTGSGEVLHDWALAGKGLAFKVSWDVQDDLAAGRLVECLADYACDEVELYAVYLSRKHLPPRVRVFLDFLRAALG